MGHLSISPHSPLSRTDLQGVKDFIPPGYTCVSSARQISKWNGEVEEGQGEAESKGYSAQLRSDAVRLHM